MGNKHYTHSQIVFLTAKRERTDWDKEILVINVNMYILIAGLLNITRNTCDQTVLLYFSN